ncbi:MAG: tRNA dihydrouridine(20/20a) synthase DusA [Pseudobdellovibrionaceae bacterium]
MSMTNTNRIFDERLSVAPMMDWTDRHCRYFHRLLAPHAVLYTEMVTIGALIHGDRARHLNFNEQESPVILQLGGSDPHDLAQSAKWAHQWGYQGINLNCGCPSDRVQKGRFGACLMMEGDLVADCVKSMREASPLPVTVKCRVGVDDQNEDETLPLFIEKMADAGCEHIIIHARKAWLKGLSPKENREIPPLRYDLAARMRTVFPAMQITVNGGIASLTQVQELLSIHHGVMIGREAYQNPIFLAECEHALWGTGLPDEEQIIEAMSAYIEKTCASGEVPPRSITRHMTGLFKSRPGGRVWRRALSELPDTPERLRQAYDMAFGKNKNEDLCEADEACTIKAFA